MAILAKGSEESVISGSIHISDWNTELRFVPSPSEPGAQAQAKHVVRALYEATFAVSELPYRAPNTRWHVARLYDGLYLHNKIIGFLSWRSVDSVGGQANTTFGTVDATNLTDTLQIDDKGEPNNAISPVDATNLTGVLQTDSHEGPDSVQKRSSSFTDPEDPNLVISYTLSDRECDYASFFSAVIEGIAIVSPNDKDDIADAVNLVSAAGDFTINLHGTETPSTFRWIDMLRCLCDIWDQVAGWKPNPRDMGFEVLYRGSRIAQGDTFTI
ncbi:hypothetical protein IMSHALPRED_001138 [Imshaugia aleurites]|uniref:Uncharacterized protein n=1 Tax=Imshaugia aleurites TaxID=172621 RepID=A0A8H3J1D4_9LECA|nr:hypothetical protein IMSHALPRED_001138 [Imshaugia aleurites]